MIKKRKDDGLRTTRTAAEALGISTSQFLRIAERRGISPSKTYDNPYYRSGNPAYLWSRKTIGRLKHTNDVKAAQSAAGCERPSKNYHSLFEKKYGSPEEALQPACEALFNLNRYTRHATCSRLNREEIFDLKTNLIEHLYKQERFTDRVEKLVRTLPAKECFGCASLGCDRCDYTGEYEPAREVASYVFTFTFSGFSAESTVRYTWMQPDRVMTFVPRVEETRRDDGASRALDSELSIPKRKLAEAKALIRYAIGYFLRPPKDLER